MNVSKLKEKGKLLDDGNEQKFEMKNEQKLQTKIKSI